MSQEEVIFKCFHIEKEMTFPHIGFIIHEDMKERHELWLCEDCFNKIGVKWIQEVLTVRVKR